MRWIQDPTGHHRADGRDLLWFVNVAGIIPNAITEPDKSFKDQLAQNLRFGSVHWTDATEYDAKLDEQGVFFFPQDPPQYPALELSIGHQTARIYTAGIVFVSENNQETWQYYRFD